MKRLLEDLLYVPVGVVTGVRDLIPELAERGRTQVGNARMMGRVAVQMGGRELARRTGGIGERVQSLLTDAGLSGPDVAGASGDGEPAPRRVSGQPDPAPAVSPVVDGPDATELAIVDYDSLAASQVVRRLAALDSDQLDDVRSYELAHRGRKTILGRVAQLQS